MTQEMSRTARHQGNPKNTKPKNTSKTKKYAKYTALGIVTVGVIGALAGAGIFAYYASSAPKVTHSALVGTSQTRLLDTNGNVIYSTDASEHEIAKQDEIPKEMRMAVVSIEDRRFYKHHGVDPRRILGAAFANFTGSSLGLQGGSTLTQQLIKLTAFSTAASDQTLKRKAQEAWLAIKLEKEYSKNQILTLYMNKVYMGNGVYGMKTAAEYYFGKDMKNLSVPEMALLAGLPQSPSGYDPYTNPKGAKARRDNVLNAMAINGVISNAAAKKYMATSISADLIHTHPSAAVTQENALVNDAYVQSTLAKLKKMGYNPYKDGLTVQTNLNPDVQQRAYDIANSDTYVNWKSGVQVAMTVVDPNNGQVMAQIGARDQPTLFGTNRATNKKQSIGSDAKPIVDYGPAVENMDWSTNHMLLDQPYTYPGSTVQPQNADLLFKGPVTMRQSLVESRNIPAIKTLQEVGYDKSGAFLKKLGINVNPKLASDAIGIDASTEQMASAYAAFDNGGTYYKPQYISQIEDQSGVIRKIAPQGSTAMKSSTAFILTDMMKSVVSNSYAKIIATNDYAQAGKTGVVAYDDNAQVPSGASVNSWFTGFTKAASISVWTGFDFAHEPGHYLAAGEEQFAALRAQHALMDYIMSGAGVDGSDWHAPASVKGVRVNGVQEYQVVGANVAAEKTIDQVVVPKAPASSSSKESKSESSSSQSSSSEESKSESSSSQSSSSEESKSESSSSDQSSSAQSSASSSSAVSHGSSDKPASSSQPVSTESVSTQTNSAH